MLDGKHGETKKFCMEKMADFGEAVDAKEMVDVSFVLNCCPIYSKDRQEARDGQEARDVRPGPQRALRSDLRDEGRPCRGRNGHPSRERSVPGAVRQGRREGLPLELRGSWQGQLPGRRGNGQGSQGGLRQADGAWLAPLALVPASVEHEHPQDGRVLRLLRVQRRGLHQHHPGRPHQSGIPRHLGLRRLHRLHTQVRQPPRRESGGQMHCRAG